jgi:uncharacterized protein
MTEGLSSTFPSWAPRPTPTTQPYWDGVANRQLWIQRCTSCAEHVFYPRTHCPHCCREGLEWVQSTGRARLLTYIISYRAAQDFEDLCPYVIAVVELNEGVRMMTNLIEIEPSPEAITLDMELEVAFRERSGVVLPLFRPAVGARA